MPELHPSLSAVGAHFDREMETALQPSRRRKEAERRQVEQPTGSKPGDLKTSVAEHREFLPADTDRQVEEMMRLAQ